MWPGGRLRLGPGVPFTGPQVRPVGVAPGHRLASQITGGVVDGRVGARGIGVGPHVMMSKAIYLTDLEQASWATSSAMPQPQDSEWYVSPSLPFCREKATSWFTKVKH